MSVPYCTPAPATNPRGANLCTRNDAGLHPIAAVMRAARALWPHKTWAELSARTGASERACKYWLARRCDLSAENLAELLRSDAGLVVLEALMGDARPEWWRKFRRTTRISQLRADIEAQRTALERLERECAE